MKLNRLLFLLFIFLNLNPALSQEFSYNLSSDSLVNFHAGNKRVYQTVRTDIKPRIDGHLEDECWIQYGIWQGDFIQQQPQQGRPPSQKTEVKILYDSDNLYVALKCYDDEPEKISAIMGRRDDFTSGDIAGIALDTYFDKSTAFEFNVSAAGQKIDLVHLGAYLWDTNWDAVWEARSQILDSMWTVEIRIPFSQLRFSDNEEQVWGMHIWRWIDRLGEENQWKLIPIDAPAMVYIFGELRGIRDVNRKRHVEIMPFVAGRQVTGGLKSERLGYGLDGKIGLSSNYTLDFTVLPDFGQVEADPSILNLSSYEVFYDEKRPFFLEGNNILDYSAGSDMLFYSRRIGHSPSWMPFGEEGETVAMPSGTTILNALKLTGKGKKGTSIGIVNSLTGKEYAEISGVDGTRLETAEPLSNYFVGRLKQDFNDGNTILGGIVTSTIRSIKEEHLEFLPERASVGGIDFLHTWKNRKYFLDLKSFYSHISGSEEAISALQRNSRHLFQRINADHLETDDTRNTMEGWGGQLTGGKQSGKFRATGTLSWRSPGLELNDLGYLREADQVNQRVNLRYQVNKPKGILQSYYFTVDHRNDWTFGGEYLNNHLNLHGYTKFSNLWSLHADFVRNFHRVDTRQLRGGPSLRLDPFTTAELFLQTNSSKKLFLGLGARRKWVDNALGESVDYTVHLQWKVSNRFTLTSQTRYEDLVDFNQYVVQRRINNETRYVVGELDRKTLYTTLRAEIFATPELSFQFYGSPYASVGHFSKLKKVQESLSSNASGRYSYLTEVDRQGSAIYLDEDGDGSYDFLVGNPDFNYQELRSNFVIRWEYRPGSTIYLVWTHNRFHDSDIYDSSAWNSLKGISGISSDNALMVKLSYWFSL